MRTLTRICGLTLLFFALVWGPLSSFAARALAEEEFQATEEASDNSGSGETEEKKKEEAPPPPKEYPVYYDPNGGEGAMDATVFIEGQEAKLARCTFTRAGYTFEGWDTAADGTGTRLADAADVSGLLREDGLTLYAQWGSQIYVIRYTSGVAEQSDSPATGEMTSQLAVHDAEVQLKDCEFEREGYTPVCWADQNGTRHEFGKLATNFSTSTDTHSWELATINADPPKEGVDGHWSCQGSSVFRNEDGDLCAAMAFYFTSSAYLGGNFDAYDSNIKLVNLNTGEEIRSARGIMLEHGNDIAYCPDNGHFYVAQGGINEGFPDGIVELNENLEEVRTVTPEGTHNIWNISYSNGRFYAIGNVNGDSFARGNPEGETSDLIVLDQDLNPIETHTVDYSLEGFSGQGMVCDGSFLYSILVNFGEHDSSTKQRLAIFTLDGEPRGTQRIDITTEVESASTLDGRMYFSTNGGDKGTVYGTDLAGATMSVVWDPNPYKIAFDDNAYPAAGIPDTIETTYDEEVPLPAEAPICPGMTFFGWNTEADGSGQNFQAGEAVHNLATSGTVTLYAQWRRTPVGIVSDNGSQTDVIKEPEEPTAAPRHLAPRHMVRIVALFVAFAMAVYTNDRRALGFSPLAHAGALIR